MSYLALVSACTLLAVVVLAWRWNQPTAYSNGVRFSQSLPVLLVAGLLANGVSFFFQDRLIRRVLRDTLDLSSLRVGRFALRFYAYNLVVSIALSVVLYLPLLMVLFFFFFYPIVLWLIPYHLLIGYVLGQQLQRAGA